MTCDGTMDAQSNKPRVESVVRLTLQDGTRIQLSAEEIAYVEPVSRGALIHLDFGEPLKVVQDVRTIELRVKVALAANAGDQKPQVDDMPALSDPIRQEAEQASTAPLAEPRAMSRRVKRLLCGRVSLPALAIARGRRTAKD